MGSPHATATAKGPAELVYWEEAQQQIRPQAVQSAAKTQVTQSIRLSAITVALFTPTDLQAWFDFALQFSVALFCVPESLEVGLTLTQ